MVATASTAPLKWTEMYRPRTLKDVLGNNKAVSELEAWARSWEEGKPVTRAVVLYGPPGSGKTSAAQALGNQLDWEYVEMNASDARTAGAINSIAGPAALSGTFSGRRRLIILDEADNLHGNADRGGASAMLKLIKNASQPVLLIANDYYGLDRAIRENAKGIQFRSIRSPTIVSGLRGICQDQGIQCDLEALELIAERADGDLRSAVNDLQAAAEGSTELSLEDVATAKRDNRLSIFQALEKVFRGKSSIEALRASYDLDESPEDLIHWIDENLPAAYAQEDLARAFNILSRADTFLGRVRIRQNYGLWRYASFLMTGGVQASRRERRPGYVAFRPPSLWRRMGQTKKARNIRDSAAGKVARHLHVSTAHARMELMWFIGSLLKSKKLGPRIAAELDLNTDEIAMLMGSNPTTKKVQAIFEESQALKEKEQTEDIEFGWRGSQLPTQSSSQSLSQLPSQASSPSASPTQSSSQSLSQSSSPSPSKPSTPGRKRSVEESVDNNSENVGDDGDKKMEKKPPSETSQGGKRQKSLFDF